MDLCSLKRWARAEFFTKDRDITLQSGRIFSGAGAVDVGLIGVWSGSIASIPTGWQLCDGTNGTPNLEDKFVVGAGSSYSVDDTGGTTSHSHSYSGNTGNGANQTDTNIDGSGIYDSRFDHTHSVSGTTGGTNHLPPYYALAFIMRVA